MSRPIKTLYDGLKAHEAKASGYTIIGKTEDGEYVRALNQGATTHSIYQPVYSEETADNSNYLMDVGAWVPSKIKPLTKADKKFLDTAYPGEMSYCQECNLAYDTESYDNANEYHFTEDGLICREDCFASYLSENPDRLTNFLNQPHQCIPLEAAESLAKKRKLKHLERFIGGWVDGRGGCWKGEYTREGEPKKVLTEFQAKYPGRDFVFSHDESGQFQQYFSIWMLAKKRGAK